MKKTVFIFVFCFTVWVTFGQSTTKTITIQPKQTLYGIAREYNVSVSELKALNPEYAPNYQMKIGAKFKIPVTGKPATTQTSTTDVKTETPKATTPVKTSSNVTETAKTVSPSVTESKPSTPSETSKVSASTTSPEVVKSTIGTHTVKKGETASTVARKYGMTLKDLLTLNKLSPKAGVKIGQKLKVRTSSSSQQMAPVIYKPINPSVIASATPTGNAEKTTTLTTSTTGKTEIAAPATPASQETAKTKAVEQEALFTDVKTAASPQAEKATQNTEISKAKEVIPNDNSIAKEKKGSPTTEAPKEEKAKFIETPKDPNAPAPIKAKDLAEKANLTSVKAPLIEQTADVTSKQLEASFNRTVNPNSKRTLRGIATVVKNPELTSSSFVLYNYAEEGDIVKVVNLMSKKILYLKVVGKMNSNESEAILQVSSDTAKLLQANEGRFLVEVTGY